MGVNQTEFVSAMLDPARDVPEGLLDPGGRGAGKRFNVYRNNVAVSLTEALVTAFPSIHRRIGDKNFRALAGIFLRAHPPASPLMMFYGEEMPEFLADFEPLSHLGHLPDLARVDLARRHSYHAADSTPIDPGRLQEIAPDALMRARLGIAPAVRVLSSPWPIFSIWRGIMEERAETPEKHAEEVLVARPEYDPAVMLLPKGGAALVTALQKGRDFANAIEAAECIDEKFDLTAALGTLLSGNAIIKVFEGDEE